MNETSLNYDRIVEGLRDSTYELNDEGRRVRAGLKKEQESAAIVERYAWLYTPEALAAAERGPQGDRVRAAILTGIIERRVAGQEDRLVSFYSGTVARLPGGEDIPYYSALAQLSREPDPARRDALGEATLVVQDQADDLALELNATVMSVLAELGYESYTRLWSELKRIDYERLRAEVIRAADRAGRVYRDWVEPRMAESGRGFGAAPVHHMPYIRGLPAHGGRFTAAGFVPAMRGTFEALGLELFSSPTIHIDLEDRPAKNPRASVWVPEAGREVHLLVRPAGGNHDYSAFLHEAGHALHYGLTDPAIGWPRANLGRSMAYPEIWSFLIERMGFEPAWIAGATGAGAAEAERISADLVGVDLMLFIRYAAKFSVELEIYAGDPLDRDRGRRLYSEVATARTGFRYDPRSWQMDRDAAFYSADYLRAWLAEAELERLLAHRFGEDWWRSRETGAWLRERWRRGSEPEAEELIAEMGGNPFSAEALLARVARHLGSPDPIGG